MGKESLLPERPPESMHLVQNQEVTALSGGEPPPRLMITKMVGYLLPSWRCTCCSFWSLISFDDLINQVLENFKSYAGEKEIGPFHKCFSSVVGPNGSDVNIGGGLQFDRSQFDVRYGSDKFFDNLGDDLIKNEITIVLDLKGKRAVA